MSKPTLFSTNILFFLFSLILFPKFSLADPLPRFFLMGDGVLVINQQTIHFRSSDGVYQDAALKKLHHLFRANWTQPEERLSLRFVEVLDFLQDKLQGGSYQLRSGYRSPILNQSLRSRGKLAAQSSMHKEGAAADVILRGVPSGEVFTYVKSLNCCGIGWYHSRHFHIDTGPPRYWDEKTSKTEDKGPQQNEKIILQADLDRYLPGEKVDLKFMRITEYPIGVPQSFQLIKTDLSSEGKPRKISIHFPSDVQKQKDCQILVNRTQARKLSASLPSSGLEPGKYSFKVTFCNRFDHEKMPEEILSRPFEILPKKKGDKN